MRIALFANVVAAVFLLLLRRSLVRDEKSLIERAQAAGEPVAAQT